MRLKKLYSFVAAFALVLCAFVFASPPSPSFAAANIAVQSEKVVQNDIAVAVGYTDSAKVAAPTAPTNLTNTSAAPPVALPSQVRQVVKRPFYGYVDSRNTGKVPIKPLDINAFGRTRPEFIPLN